MAKDSVAKKEFDTKPEKAVKKEKKAEKQKARRAGKFSSFLRRHDMTGYVFLLPWLLGLFVFVVYPVVMSIIFSVSEVNIKATGIVYKFIGRGNFTWIFQKNTSFIEATIDFLSNTVLSLPVILVFSMIVAMLLNTKIRFKGLFRVIFFLPVIIVSGPVMQQLSSQGATTVPMIEESGLISMLQTNLPEFLADPIVYVFKQIILILWFSGVQILIILAGLQKIDSSIYEAAAIDGASTWESFWKITLPSLKPMLLLNAIYTLVSLAQHDDNAVISTIKSTLLNPDTSKGGYGKAAAMAWVYMAVILIILGIILLIFRDRHKKSEATKRAERQQKELLRLRRKQKRRRRNAA